METIIVELKIKAELIIAVSLEGKDINKVANAESSYSTNLLSLFLAVIMES